MKRMTTLPAGAALLLCLFFLFPCFKTAAQTNVRAWYADGQVWVVWEYSLPLPEWCSVYAKATPFTSTTNATLIGRPNKFEYLLFSLKEQVDTAATPRIPGPGGNGSYQLALNEALFVFTPHQSGSLYFAVVADEATQVTLGQNITAASVPFLYNPQIDPVECHLQRVFPSPFAAGFVCQAFLMWADGRQNQWESRPDFPVMANAAKNGMPSLFFVSAPVGLDTTQPFPLSVWLHGGGGSARQSLAGSRQEINIKPEAGVLLSHDDNHVGWHGLVPPNPESPSWHFGWRKNYDPFQSGNLPTVVDTIVNYTQRRYLWIDAWLIRHYNIDPSRIHIHGHSMGSAGALALVKCYPDHYASATIFNTGCGGPEPGSSDANFGPPADNFPTNLKNRDGETVQMLSLFNLLDNCSNQRDIPIIRHWHSKNDDNGTMRWDPYVVENYIKADSIGMGIQNMWSERAHGVDTGPDYNDHWVNGSLPTQNTIVDNVAFAENRFSSQQSFPAFFNHRLDAKNNDPGTGLIGINNGDGDNWGAWGGYHRWDSETLQETEHQWAVTAWLESEAVFSNDHCPNNFLTADLAIRRPQQFKPLAGQPVYWRVVNEANGTVLQSGSTIVQPDDLVVIPQVNVFKESIGKVRIEIADILIGTGEAQVTEVKVVPNPAGDFARLQLSAGHPASGELSLLNAAGISVFTQYLELQEGINELDLPLQQLPPGLYFVRLVAGEKQGVWRLVKR